MTVTVTYDDGFKTRLHYDRVEGSWASAYWLTDLDIRRESGIVEVRVGGESTTCSTRVRVVTCAVSTWSTTAARLPTVRAKCGTPSTKGW